MKIIKGRRGKSRVVDEYIKSYLDQGKKVVMFDTVGVKAIAHEGGSGGAPSGTRSLH